MCGGFVGDAVSAVGSAVEDVGQFAGDVVENQVQEIVNDPAKAAVKVALISTGNAWALPIVEGGSTTTTVATGLAYITGNSVVVTSQSSPLTTRFEGTVGIYNSLTGSMTIVDITNIKDMLSTLEKVFNTLFSKQQQLTIINIPRDIIIYKQFNTAVSIAKELKHYNIDVIDAHISEDEIIVNEYSE